MIRRTCMTLIVGAVVTLAACGDTSPAVTAPTSPRLDGGWTAGSGNRDSDSTTTTTTAEAEQDSTQRGGWTVGSGN